jgi:uncharacterized membrane protein YphA (DoxX/SURF4 family)
MKITKLPSWAGEHFAYFLDLVRIYLGIGLVIKGISFLTGGAAALSAYQGPLASFAAMVPYVHIVGGVLLAFGLLTRVAALAQIPFLLGALFMLHLPQVNTLRGREGVEFSALVLFLLALIFVRGGGPLSIDQRFRRARPTGFQLWVDERSDVFADAVRIYLGIALFIKGMYIVGHREEIFAMVNGPGNLPFWLTAASHYVIPAHFVGGALLALGILTRGAALAQIPLLLGAVFYLFLPGFTGLEMRQSLEFTTLVLFLLSLVAVFGAGKVAIEHPSKVVAYRPNPQAGATV